jgi:hypothetical protein
MGAEARLGRVPAPAVAIAENRVQPPVGLAALGKIIDEFQVSVACPESAGAADLVEVECNPMVARQTAEAVSRHLAALGIVEDGGDRQLPLAGRHRRRQHGRPPFSPRQDRRREQITFAEGLAESREVRVGDEIAALDVEVGDAPPALRDDLITGPHEMLSGMELDLPRPEQAGQKRADLDPKRGKGRDLLRDRRHAFFAHRREPQRARRNRRRVAVLNP